MMQYVLYQSESAASLPSDEVFRIISTSAKNNPQRGITGFLIFAHDRFIQLIEGEGEALDTLLADLERDPRHKNLVVLSRNEISERVFPRWRMERISVKNAGIEDLLESLRAKGLAQATCTQIKESLSPLQAC